MTTSNTVYPVAAFDQGKIVAVVIPLPNGNFSTALLNADSTEAWFPLDYDEQDRETATSAAYRFASGFFGTLADYQKDHRGYTMPYPIQLKTETKEYTGFIEAPKVYSTLEDGMVSTGVDLYQCPTCGYWMSDKMSPSDETEHNRQCRG